MNGTWCNTMVKHYWDTALVLTRLVSGSGCHPSFGKWGKKFRSLFDPAGLGLDDAFNKVKIKGDSGGHGWYNEDVFERLSNAVASKSGTAYRTALVRELMDLRWEVKKTQTLVI